MGVYADFSIDQGSDFYAEITVADAVNSDLDLTDYTVKAQFRNSIANPDGYALRASVIDASTISLELSHQETANLRVHRYFYDVLIISPANFVTRIAEGLLEVTPGVTRLNDAPVLPPGSNFLDLGNA